MSFVTISAQNAGRPFRPAVERLEDRAVPATLLSRAQDVAFLGADAPVEVLGASDDGQQVLFQSRATNLISGQIDVPDTMDLFVLDRGTVRLITALDGNPVKAIGVTTSVPGVINNAVISADGTAVAFLSGTPAIQFNKTAYEATTDGGGEDLFVWSRPDTVVTGTPLITLGSITAPNTNGDKFSVGTNAKVTNPAISADGNSYAFVSDTSAGVFGDYFVGYSNAGKFAFVHGAAGPNIYRAGLGETPIPASILTFRANFEDPAGGEVDDRDYYFFYDSVVVDPLGRYMDGSGVSFVGTVGNQISFGVEEVLGLPTPGRDVVRWSYGGRGFVGISPSNVYQTVTPQGVAVGISGTGTAETSLISRDQADVVFTATVTSGAFVADYVNANGGTADVYRATSGETVPAIDLVSKAAGTANTGLNGVIDTTPGSIQVTPDSRRVTYTSSGTTAVVGVQDKNAAFDVFQRDFERNATSIISVTAGNRFRTGNAASRNPTQTLDGLLVAFESDATDMSAFPDANRATDVFIRDLSRRTTSTASVVPGNFRTGTGRTANAVFAGTFTVGQLYFNSTSTDIDPRAKVVNPVPDIVTDPNAFTPPDSPTQLYTITTPILINNASRVVAFAGGPNGSAAIAQTDIDGNLIPGTRYEPFPGFRGELRIATADLTGDGTPDLIVGAGAGGGPRVQVINGFTGRVADDFFAFESTFTGGVYVAAGDFNADGRADLVVGAGELGGPRVQIYDSASRKLIVDRFAFEPQSRVGVHVAAGDFTGDGLDDLIVGAGVGGGPRVRVFDGQNVAVERVVADFFAFDVNQRSGAYVSAGDFDNDGFADLVVGTGPGVGTRVRIYNAANLSLRDPNVPVTFRDFAPFGEGDTSGARPVIRNIEGLENPDIVVANASGLPRISAFSGNTSGGGTLDPTLSTTPARLTSFIPFDALSGDFGAYVG